jgi:hypothetical protein
MKEFKEFLDDPTDEMVADESSLSDAMWDFISSFDEQTIEGLDEYQLAEYIEIVEAVAGEEEEGEDEEGDDDAIEEAMPAKKVRRDVIQKRKASREHRKVKAKKKIEGRRKRKTASFKRFKKKAKRLGKRGLTSTGKRKRTFINKG